MKKLSLFVLIIIAVFLFSAFNETYSQSTPKISISVNKKTLSAGETGIVTIKFKTGSKVKISVEPEIEVTLSGSNIEGIGLQPVSSSGEYLSPSQVKYKFKVSGNASSGSTIKVSGSVKFGYCSSDSGICKIGNKSFSFNVKVK